MSARYSKVTVIVETGDTKEVLEVFKAERITFEERAISNEVFTDALGPRVFFKDMMDLGINLTAFYDGKEACIFRTTRTTTAKEMKA